MSGNEIAVKCSGITKTFGGVVANDDINLEVKYGEILALLGENGSGKTTLMNMLSGIYHPDKGTIAISGKAACHKFTQGLHCTGNRHDTSALQAGGCVHCSGQHRCRHKGQP